MIKRIEIQNFQGYKKETFEFSKGLNVIVGPTDAGKSTIRRAVEWVARNRPLGDKFRNNSNEGETSVKINLGKEGQVERLKGTGKNLYSMTGLHDRKFKAFGSDVPVEIENLLNISGVNFQTQHSQPFLLFDSPGEVARYINKIVDLDVIDKSLARISLVLKSEKTSISNAKLTLEEREEELKSYNWVEQVETEYTETLKTQNKLKELCSERGTLSDLIFRLSVLKKEKEKLNRILKLKKEVKDVETAFDLLSSKRSEVQKIELLVLNFEKAKRKVSSLSIEIANKKKKYNELMPDVCPLCGQEVKNGNL